MNNRPATREEIISRYAGRKVQFETHIREVSDSRTASGVRHITKATALIRNVDGVPVVSWRGEDFELFASFFTLDTGRSFVACPTIRR